LLFYHDKNKIATAQSSKENKAKGAVQKDNWIAPFLKYIVFDLFSLPIYCEIRILKFCF